MRPIVVERAIALSSRTTEVWPLVTDTERTNRLALSEAVSYRPIERGARSAARFVGRTRAAGFELEYEEAPFEWKVNERFSIHRKMRSGPLASYTYGLALAPREGGGTTVTVRLELHARHWLYWLAARIEGERVVRRISDLAAKIDAHLHDGAPSPYLEPASPANEESLAHAAEDLKKRGVAAEATAALLELIRKGPDADLVRIRPFDLAHRCGVDGREMLRALLHSVPLGIVELRWAIVCPSCLTASDHVATLAELTTAGGHCQLCDITYDLELDRAVEATFVPHPNVRQIEDRLFCIGGPWRTPHVLAQANVDARGILRFDAPAEVGRFRLFARGGAVASLLVEREGAGEVRARLEEGRLVPAELRVAPSGIVELENTSDEPLHAKIERLGYATLAATAHDVTTMSEFRRLFSKDLLKPGTPLKVTSATILFSDLTGSTALYTSAGDAAAFRLVDDHFDVLRRAIGASGGTVVKTMGDAVMAAFTAPSACVRAAVQCLRAFEELRRTHPHGKDTGLKIGLFSGPCYLVTANDTIDYFGQTVNCASRVQHLAGSAEIMLEAAVFDRLPTADRTELEVIETLDANVKGVDKPLRLVRTRLAR